MGGFLYEVSGHSKEFPFLITSIPIILDALARMFIIGTNTIDFSCFFR